MFPQKGNSGRKNIVARGTEIARLSKEIEGVKQSTGQHPGGIVVLPQNINYYDIVPIQYPVSTGASFNAVVDVLKMKMYRWKPEGGVPDVLEIPAVPSQVPPGITPP